MKLTNKVTNAFFSIIAVIGLFMPLFGFSTLLVGEEYSLADLIGFLKDANFDAEHSLLRALEPYGFKTQAILVAVFFIVMLVCLLALLVLSFINVPYLVRTITSGVGLGAYITAVAFFSKICAAFVKGIIPTSAITSLASGGQDSGDLLSSLVSSFVSVQKMGVTTGVYVGIACFAILFLVNLVFVIFRKRFDEADRRSQ